MSIERSETQRRICFRPAELPDGLAAESTEPPRNTATTVLRFWVKVLMRSVIRVFAVSAVATVGSLNLLQAQPGPAAQAPALVASRAVIAEIRGRAFEVVPDTDGNTVLASFLAHELNGTLRRPDEGRACRGFTRRTAPGALRRTL